MIKRLVALTGILVAACLLVAGLLGSAGAQDLATPTAGTPDHPAHIHTGTCPTLGDVEFPLENVTLASEAPASPEASLSRATVATPAAAGDLLTSTTIVETTLDDLLGAEHAINVHESAGEHPDLHRLRRHHRHASDGMLLVELEELKGRDHGTGDADRQRRRDDHGRY